MKRSIQGFSLIELMVVTAIIGISLAIGLPSFTSIVSKIRMDGEINAVLSGLNYARSEAVKRGQPVVVCPSTNASSCATGTGWSTGWIVLLNTTTTQVLQSTSALTHDTLSSTSTATPSYPQFTSMGYTFFTGTLTLHDALGTHSLYRCIVFAAGSWTAQSGSACP